MKRIFLIVLLCSMGIQTIAQEHDPFIAYSYTKSKWDPYTRTYKDLLIKKCKTPVFLLKDRIKIKDDDNSILYTTGNSNTVKEKQFEISVYNCLDKVGNDCVATLIYDTATNDIVLLVGRDDIQYTYHLRLYNYGTR